MEIILPDRVFALAQLPGPGWWLVWSLIFGATAFLFVLYGLFWLWMLVQCLRHEPDKLFWLWLLIVVPFPGAIVYAAVRYFPAAEVSPPPVLQRWLKRKDLDRLQAAAEQIGNPHQYIQYGDALRDVGRWDDAGQAYDEALRKDPENLPALWGAALVAEHNDQHADVVELCRKILAREPQYKFGDVSLALGKALVAAGETEAARTHLEQHIRRWRHPEGMFLLAELCRDAGDVNAATQHLRAMLQDLNSSPTAIARKHGRWKSRAKQLLRTLDSGR